jgi:hypothetical protein
MQQKTFRVHLEFRSKLFASIAMPICATLMTRGRKCTESEKIERCLWLVRPDGYVSWQSHSGNSDGRCEMDRAIVSALGKPIHEEQ